MLLRTYTFEQIVITHAVGTQCIYKMFYSTDKRLDRRIPGLTMNAGKSMRKSLKKTAILPPVSLVISDKSAVKEAV